MGCRGDSKRDYCGYASDMSYKGGHACFEHRTRLVEDKDKLTDKIVEAEVT